MNDDIGDRMKVFEAVGSSSPKLMPGLPIIIRLDGKAFHTFTRGLDRPFDLQLVALMRDVTARLLEISHAKIGYTQSDEITLVLHAEGPKAMPYFDGRRDKLISVLASYATLHFNKGLLGYLPNKVSESPVFDGRAFSVPSKAEACNCLIWREWDAAKNSISMMAQAHFSHHELEGVNGSQKQEMLFQRKGINWSKLPDHLKRGTYIRRENVTRTFTARELESLPPKHAAHANPELPIVRSVTRVIKMPELAKVVNREAVVFDGAIPLTA